MKIRPQKHVRQGFSGKSKLQRRSQPKTRKEIRKEKRQQKKINRFNYHSRKRSDRYQGGDKDGEDPLEKQKRGKGDGSGSEEDEWDDDDEEIDSDLGEDVEVQDEPVKPEIKKGKGGKKSAMSQMELEREEELRELNSYEQGLREKRISQLEAANAEDDAIIKKYEKLLKINRRKNKDGVPKSFNDGLDYALELCTEENIRKMYDAAREAAELEQNSEDEFADDFGEVLGKKQKKSAEKPEGKGKKKLSDKERKRMEKLKEVEKKYLGDDEMDDGSLGGFDSELDIELASDYSENDELYDSEEDAPVEKSNGKQKKVAFKEDKKKKAQSESEPEEDSEFDEDVFGLDSEDSEVEPIPIKTKKDSSKGKKNGKPEPECDSDDELKKLFANKKKNKDSSNGKQKQNKKRAPSSESEPEEDSEFDEDVFGLDSEDSEVEEPIPKKNKKDASKGKKKDQPDPEEDDDELRKLFANKKKNKDSSNGKQKQNKKKAPSSESEPEENSEFDEDVFGLDSEDEIEEPVPKSKKKDNKKVTFEKKASKNDKNKKKQQSESEPEEDSEFDEEVFGGDSEDDGLDNILDGIGSDAEEPKAKDKNKEKSDVWEDIYGRKRDKDGNVIKEDSAATGGKYVPPHMRARMEAQSGAGDAKRQEKLARLKRTLKGQINRLAETNVHRISIELDNLYMQNARFDVNNLLTTLILEAIVSKTLSPERMVLEHVLLVTILHANVGSEVGSHFLETIVERFHSLIGQIDAFDVEDKTLDNCVLILCHLYTFAIFKNKLIYDVIDQLLVKFCEKAVECILLVLRSIGFVLRKDDPLALKDMILKVQKRAAEAPQELKNDTRVKFMLDTLLAVKNNNMNKIPQYDPTLVEHFRKILKGMITSGKYVSSLNIGLDDLLNVEERGKWWLVGSAWIGDAAGGKRGGATKNGSPQEEGFSQQLLELARKQRMNTDDKRNVFCAIMSAEDYLDAFDKILRLAIKDQRIVASVIVHCALAEKDHNPYYSVLSEKFCEYDRRYQLAIQYTIWDRLKDIQSLKQAPIRNLAKLLTHLIGEGGLALSVLKVIEFAEIDKPTLRLVRQTMLGLLLLEEENKCLQVFNRIAPSFKLKSFKDSLRLFLHHFLLKGSDRSGVPDEQMQLLHQRIKMAERMLDTSEARVQF